MRRPLALVVLMTCAPGCRHASVDAKVALASPSSTAQTSTTPGAAVQAEVDEVLERVRGAVAREDHAVALAILERERSRFSDPVAQARIEAAWAGTVAGLGRVDEALAAANRSVEAIDAMSDVPARYRAEIHNGLGAVQFSRGKLEEAAASFRRALSHYERDGDQSLRQRGRTRFNLSMAQAHLGELDESLATAKRALDDETRSGAPACPDLAITRGHIAFVLDRLGRQPEAEEVLRTAIAECEAVEDGAVVRAQMEIILAHALAARGELPGALASVRSAKEVLANRPDLASLQVKALLAEATVYRRGGEVGAALEALAIAQELTPRLPRRDPVEFSLCFEELLVRSTSDPFSEFPELVTRCREVARGLGMGPGSAAWTALDGVGGRGTP